ncbi:MULTISPECIES: hypothetical protein [Aminobacter]|uniref:hypothetical protein n=1 Tax=Aminobacter TaxID=31988 RepID=UPI000D391EC1|nr:MULTISPECIES: hypothetical protein [Aminobacter]AWC25481.1 hypothetical protein CO731_04978 [Aminobacter sp. MSH1]CAI2936062.1 conserved exported protein of unknown function [Aminobacter niigataensis]
MISRRSFLGRSIAGVSAMAAVSLPAAASTYDKARLSHFQIDDDHACLVARRGDVIAYNTQNCHPVDGAMVVTLTDKSRRLFLCRARQVGGLWWAERLDGSDWYGPMDEPFFHARIQGRAVALARQFGGAQ